LRDIDEHDKRGLWKGSKPVGPLGRHVKLIRKDYQQVIESLLYRTLNGFGVQTQEDVSLLLDILKKHQSRLAIFKYSGDELDYSQGLPDREYLTILNCLQIDHPVAKKLLIINNNIEKTVLVRSHREGDQVTANGFPRNVANVFTQDLYTCGSRYGGSSTKTLSKYKGVPLLSESNQETMKTMRYNLEVLNKDGFQLKEALNRLDHEMRNLDSQKRGLFVSNSNLARS
jgi:chromosome segregation ATPase